MTEPPRCPLHFFFCPNTTIEIFPFSPNPSLCDRWCRASQEPWCLREVWPRLFPTPQNKVPVSAGPRPSALASPSRFLQVAAGVRGGPGLHSRKVCDPWALVPSPVAPAQLFLRRPGGMATSPFHTHLTPKTQNQKRCTGHSQEGQRGMSGFRRGCRAVAKLELPCWVAEGRCGGPQAAPVLRRGHTGPGSPGPRRGEAQRAGPDKQMVETVLQALDGVGDPPGGTTAANLQTL